MEPAAQPADSPLRRLLDTLGTPPAEIDAAAAKGPAALAALAANRAAFPGPRVYTPRDVWERAGVAEDRARSLWRAMGFPDLDDHETALTEADLDALRTVSALGGAGVVDDATILQLARVMSQAVATIAAAQIEAVAGRTGADSGEEATLAAALELARSVLPTTDQLLVYLYRRHLANANERAVFRSTAIPEGMPSLAVGFADLVDFTGTSRSVDDDELATLVESFSALAAGHVATAGGRVVKMIGDEVMYTTDDPAAAALVALDLIDGVRATGLGEVRAGVAVGGVLRAQGDVFGPTVNLAARLVTAARPDSLLVDEETGPRLENDDRFFVKPVRPQKLKGIGRVPAFVVRRFDSERSS